MANLSVGRWDLAVKEHEGIINALSARNGALLQSLLREHLGQKMLAVLAALAKPD